MYDFRDIGAATTDQQIRAWSVEQAIDALRMVPFAHQDVVTLAKVIEDYVSNGDVSGVIQSAVEEGYSEGRFEVKEAVEEWFSDVDLNDLFQTKGWAINHPEEG